jgi:hypothetical protein
MAEELEPRRCPYCGCGFTPSVPEQVYCSKFCEEQHALETGERAPDQG